MYTLLQANAIYQAKQKLESIAWAQNRPVSAEDLIRYAHRISSTNAVSAPLSWQQGDPRRPYPTGEPSALHPPYRHPTGSDGRSFVPGTKVPHSTAPWLGNLQYPPHPDSARPLTSRHSPLSAPDW